MGLGLSELMRGRRVDLNTPLRLSLYFRDEVLAEAELLYALDIVSAEPSIGPVSVVAGFSP